MFEGLKSYTVYFAVEGTYACVVEASSAEDAEERACRQASITLCHACSRQDLTVELGQVTEITVKEEATP